MSEALSVSSYDWVRGYRLSDQPARATGMEHWSIQGIRQEAARFADVARQAEAQNGDLMKPLRTWMLAFALSDYCLEDDTTDSQALGSSPGTLKCHELHAEAILQIGRLLPFPGGLCCAVREAGAFLRSAGASALSEERQLLWKDLVQDIDRVQCGGQAEAKECAPIALVRDMRHKVRLALRDASPLELLRFFDERSNQTSHCATAGVGREGEAPSELPLVCAYGAQACSYCDSPSSSTRSQDLQLHYIGPITPHEDETSVSSSLDMFHNLQPLRSLDGADGKGGVEDSTFLSVFRRHSTMAHEQAVVLLAHATRAQAPNAALATGSGTSHVSASDADCTAEAESQTVGIDFASETVEGGASASFSLGAADGQVGAGEDPRLVWHAGRYYVYLQELVVPRPGAPSVVQISVVDLDSRMRTVLVPPERTPSDIAPHGKNWVPFSWDGALHFVYRFEPLRVLRCDRLDVSPCNCTLVQPRHGGAKGTPTESPNNLLQTQSVGIFRGGSAGVLVPRGLDKAEGGDDGSGDVVGIGHVTFTEYSHAAFLWRLEMPSLRLHVAVSDPNGSVSPLGGYTVADPTSLWLSRGKWYATLTLRRHPDFLTFDQRDHAARVFEVRSGLLDGLG